jgi:hypothetical protein
VIPVTTGTRRLLQVIRELVTLLTEHPCTCIAACSNSPSNWAEREGREAPQVTVFFRPSEDSYVTLAKIYLFIGRIEVS